MRAHEIHWTPDMDRALLSLRGRVYAEEIARRVGVSPWAMYRRLRLLGAPLRPCRRGKRK